MPRGVRRVRDAQNEVARAVQVYGFRRFLLSLESGLPSEVSWALNALLVASCDTVDPHSAGPIGTTFRLDSLVSVQRNPPLLRALLPLAIPPADGEAMPGEGSARELAMLHHRQAWLLLRNMALLPENEQPMAHSLALRRLVLWQLQSALQAHDADEPLRLEDIDLEAADTAARGTAEEAAGGQCQVNPLCTRGYRHGGRGGPCRISRHDKAEATERPSGAPRPVLPASLSSPGAEGGPALPPLLSRRYVAEACACAAELLHLGLKHCKLDSFCDGVPVRAGLPSSLEDLLALLLCLLLSGEHTRAAPTPDATPPHVVPPDASSPDRTQTRTDPRRTHATRAPPPRARSPPAPLLRPPASPSFLATPASRPAHTHTSPAGEPGLAHPAVEALARLAAHEPNEHLLSSLARAHPSSLAPLAEAASGAVPPNAPHGSEVAAALAQDAALELLLLFASSADLTLKRLLASSPLVLPRLVGVIAGAGTQPPPAVRRSASILQHLASVHGHRQYFRAYEPTLAQLGSMHSQLQPDVPMILNQVLSELSVNV